MSYGESEDRTGDNRSLHVVLPALCFHHEETRPRGIQYGAGGAPSLPSGAATHTVRITLGVCIGTEVENTVPTHTHTLYVSMFLSPGV